MPESAPALPSRGWNALRDAVARARWPVLMRALIIIAAAWWVYWPALRGGWMMDDTFYLVKNPLLHDASGLWKILFVPGSFLEYYPIEGAFLWVEWHLWHEHTLGYHVCNLVFHIINALLVWRLLERMGLRLGWLGGLIFAIHPVQVESVAWISELKNTLSLMPFLLAMCCYLDYDRDRRGRDYAWALGLFVVAMLCKITMALFPFVILLCAWWKHGRVTWRDLKAAAPFLVVAVVLGLTTQLAGMAFRHFEPESPVPLGGFLSRLACGGLSLSFYFSQSVLPLALEPIYPQWRINPPSPAQFLPWLVMGGVFWFLWKKRNGWGRHALLGLGFFTINLLPFLGFNAISYMHATWVMDHFLYLPIIGLIGLATAALGDLQHRFSAGPRFAASGAVLVVLALLAGQSRGYARAFVNETEMWIHFLSLNPKSSMAHHNVGTLMMQRGDLTSARQEYEAALAIDPTDPKTMADLGTVLLRLGHADEAMEKYEGALQIDPDYAEASYDLGNALREAGRLPEAIDRYRQALKLDSNYAEAHNNLGSALVQSGRVEDGMDEYAVALTLDPNYAEAHYNLGSALMEAGRVPGAMEEFEIALRIDPNYAEAMSNLGNALMRQGKYSDAILEYRAALAIDSGIAEAHNGLGGALQQSGQLEEAAEQYVEAIKLKPGYAEARLNLGVVLSRMGMFAEAQEQVQAALKLLPASPVARTSLGNVYLRAGKFPEAAAQYRLALKLDPDFAEAHNNLGAALEQQGRPAQAAGEYREALRINPGDAQAQENLARVTAKKPSH